MRFRPAVFAVLLAAGIALLLAAASAAKASQALTPAQLHSAYALPTRGARGQTIAVVSAYNAPNAAGDLAAYSKRFGLPPCTVADGCLRVLNQDGKTAPLPQADPTGGQFLTESSVGAQLAHAVCQSCKVMLVEANSPSNYDLAPAISAAAKAGATVTVTAIDPIESPTDATFAAAFTQPHTAVVAATGDAEIGSYGFTGDVHFPSTLPDVVAVGGTQLELSRSDGYAREGAWAGTVSGCSSYFQAPTWQTMDAAASTCGPLRPVADIAAVADPGALVRVSGAGVPGGPWFAATGTSVSAPIVAGVIGLAGSAGSGETKLLYDRLAADPGALHDIRTGGNAPYCGNRICKADQGYDGPTGLGTPYGLEAFLPGGPVVSSAHPRITLAAPGRGVAIDRRWRVRIPLANGNAFRVSGSLILRRALRIGGRLRTLQFGTTTFRLGPLAGAGPRVTIATDQRRLLARLGSLTAYARLRVRGAMGRTVTVTRRVRIKAP